MEVLPFSSLLGKMRSLALNIPPCPCQGCSGSLWTDLFSMFCQFSVAGDFINWSLIARRELSSCFFFFVFTLLVATSQFLPHAWVSFVTWFPNLLLYFYFLNTNKLQNLELESNSWKVHAQFWAVVGSAPAYVPCMISGWSQSCLSALPVYPAVIKMRRGWEDDV